MSHFVQPALPATPTPMEAHISKLPRYFSWPSWLLVAGFVYLNTSLSYELNGPPRDNLIQQLAIFALFCVAWFGWVGLRLSNAIFATVALGPAVLTEGYGYFFIPFAALTPADLMMLVSIGLWLRQKPRLHLRGYIRLTLMLFSVCALSALLTLNLSFLGLVLRLGFGVWLVWIVLSERGQSLKRAFVDGLVLMPFTALAYLGGVDGLWRFVSFSEGQALDTFNTGEVLFGSHQVVMYLVFLVPLMLVLKRRVFAIPLSIAIAPYVVFSMSRSLIIAVGVAFFAYLLANARTRRGVLRAVLAALLFGVVVAGVSQIGFFSFTEDGAKAGSNHVRFAKMRRAWDTYLGSPVLGVGFGAVGALDTRKRDVAGPVSTDPYALDFYTNVQASSEFTPLQILAETGTLGGILSVWLLIFAGRRCLLVLRSPSVPSYVQFALYGWIIVFVSGFVGGNAYGGLIVSLAIPVAAYEAYLRPLQPQRKALPPQSPST